MISIKKNGLEYFQFESCYRLRNCILSAPTKDNSKIFLEHIVSKRLGFILAVLIDVKLRILSLKINFIFLISGIETTEKCLLKSWM